ncbi:unnamed protein product [Ranitomeya imitator]|uniref:Uncharacterized protein n=1 Tax=Ranitomeya imitator TaxID=111125 RepID=A0ABN9MF60_9NEOB|nr:unnamed protein product [Ranitomeya imitator]
MSGIKGGANCQKSLCQNPCKDPCQKVPICVNPCQDPCQSGSQYSGYSNQQGRGQFPKQATLQRYRQRSGSLQRRCLVAGELSHRQLSSDQLSRGPR